MSAMLNHYLPSNVIPELEALAKSLGLPDFDLLLVADGSGNLADQPAGWACLAYDRRARSVVLHAGAGTCGTNNYAELMPFVQALWHHDTTHPAPRPYTATVLVSDSELTVRCGLGIYTPKANGCLWAAMNWFGHHGYDLHYHHVPRNSNAYHALMDRLAGQARQLIMSLGLNGPRTAEKPSGACPTSAGSEAAVPQGVFSC
jgi:ribonuclease HI